MLVCSSRRSQHSPMTRQEEKCTTMRTTEALPFAISLLVSLFLQFVTSEDTLGRLIHDYSLQTHISKSLWWPERHKRSLEDDPHKFENRTFFEDVLCPSIASNDSCVCYRDPSAVHHEGNSTICCRNLLSRKEANSTTALDVHNLPLENITDVIDILSGAITSAVMSYCTTRQCDLDVREGVTSTSIIALDPLKGDDGLQYLRVLFVMHVKNGDTMTSQDSSVMSQTVVQEVLTNEKASIQRTIGYEVTMADNSLSWSCKEAVMKKKGFTKTEMAGIVIGGMWLAGTLLAYCCSIRKAVVQRRAIKKRIKERRLARLERMKEQNDKSPLTPEENSDIPSIAVTQIPSNNNQFKVKATVHNHTTNGDIITNGAANGHVVNGSVNGGIPNGHVIGHLEVETGEINRGEGVPLETEGEELQDVRVDVSPSTNLHPKKDSKYRLADDMNGRPEILHNDVSDDVRLVPQSQLMSPISELPEVNEDLNSNGHLTNGVILQARRLSRPLKHSMSEQEVSLATTVANAINMRKVFSKRRIKSEELVSSKDFIHRDKGIDNHALT